MKTEKSILAAFILNLSFSIFEFFGGFYSGSIAILSDSIHDLGDAVSIGLSYIFERKSKKKPDNKYSYGYRRYSVIGSLFSSLVLLIGSIFVIYGAINRIINPKEINYSGMIIFGIVGVCVNFIAALFTKKGESVNQKAVNLHMLEDTLGWIVVLIGAIIMYFTHDNFEGIIYLDPIMCIGVSIFILIATIKNLVETIGLLLEKTPKNINIQEIKEHVENIEGVKFAHHIHVWTLDGNVLFSTLHVVTDSDSHEIKELVKERLKEDGIAHSTVEIESSNEECNEKECVIDDDSNNEVHHHHHH